MKETDTFSDGVTLAAKRAHAKATAEEGKMITIELQTCGECGRKSFLLFQVTDTEICAYCCMFREAVARAKCDMPMEEFQWRRNSTRKR